MNDQQPEVNHNVSVSVRNSSNTLLSFKLIEDVINEPKIKFSENQGEEVKLQLILHISQVFNILVGYLLFNVIMNI